MSLLELVAKTNECEDLQEELINARKEQKEAEAKIPRLEAALKKAQSEHSNMKQNRSKVRRERAAKIVSMLILLFFRMLLLKKNSLKSFRRVSMT